MRIALLAFALSDCSNPPPATCTPACADGYHCDNGACIADGTVDAGGPDTGNAGCTPACGGLTPHCNDQGHCVGCTADAQCPGGQYCKIVDDTHASCAPGCTGDDRCGGGAMKCCNMRCVDTGADANNCGACGKSCAAANASGTCAAGQCGPPACDPGWGDCDGNPANGCEANLHVDPMNCTACGTTCALKNAINACADGCYVAACMFGFDDCNGDASDGCELSVLSDPNNCGGCGQSCTKVPHATAACTNGNCVLGKCDAGYANCDGIAANGCEVNLLSDANNCSACGMACPMNLPNCGNGTCTLMPVLVGSYMVDQGPAWGGNPPCYTCQEACAMLFGGVAGSYSCSTQMGMTDHKASVDGWGDSSHCGMNYVAENYKLNTNYDCGMGSCSFSAYVMDHSCTAKNYCFH